MKKNLSKEVFVCLDCESTGLDPSKDRIIEFAAVKFSFEKIIDKIEFLIDPEMPIPHESFLIHNISDDMLKDKPKINSKLSDIFEFISSYPIVGHGIDFDIALLMNEAKRFSTFTSIDKNPLINTLRLARLYGQSEINSLEALRRHFNIDGDGAHRAMNDVMVNIEVFKKLSTKFKFLNDLLSRLKKPIAMKRMPLGKYKGREFKDIPFDYLRWAAGQNFDQDLLYSMRLEIKKRKTSNTFSQASNPFSNL